MKRFSQLSAFLLAACGALSTVSCSMMEEDRSDCPTGLYVRFVYDYNIQRADMFKDHVGYVVVYVYDEAGHKVAEKSVANTQAASPLSQYAYTMHFTTGELPTGHTYRLQAVAMQKDWQQALGTPGAKYRLSDEDTYGRLSVTLDHGAADTSDPIHGGQCLVSNDAPLDTLWHSMKVTAHDPQFGYQAPAMDPTARPYLTSPDRQTVTLREGYATYATISMMRDTKHLNITLRQIEEPEVLNADDYEVYVVDANSTLGIDSIATGADGQQQVAYAIGGDSLRYLPYAQRTTLYDGSDVTIDGDVHPATRGAVEERTAHFNFMLNRLRYGSIDQQAKLIIRNRTTGITVCRIGLASFLAECRISPYWSYPAQEYLDREYDYELNFFLKGDRWAYCSIAVHVLPWAVRKQNEEL